MCLLYTYDINAELAKLPKQIIVWKKLKAYLKLYTSFDLDPVELQSSVFPYTWKLGWNTSHGAGFYAMRDKPGLAYVGSSFDILVPLLLRKENIIRIGQDENSKYGYTFVTKKLFLPKGKVVKTGKKIGCYYEYVVKGINSKLFSKKLNSKPVVYY